MARFDGTPADDTITPSTLSAGVFANPSASFPSEADDTIYGFLGNDTIDGGAGDDRIDPGEGDDTVFGGDGNDYIDDSEGRPGGGGYDEIHGGGGNDLIVSFGGVLYGDDGNDNIWADQNLSGDVVYGGLGNDHLYASDGGADYLFGGDGSDELYSRYTAEFETNYLFGGAGNDSYHVESIYYEINELADEGTDTLYSDVGVGSEGLPDNVENLQIFSVFEEQEYPAVYAYGNSLGNTITGNDFANEVYGLAGNDTLYGRGGADRLNGGTGADAMRGEVGDDFYYVDNAGDRVIEAAGQGGDTVYSTVSFTLGANVERLYLTGTTSANAAGNDQANLIAGNSFVNTLRGLGGPDTFQSGNGADPVIGGTGNDVFQFLSTVGSNPSARDTLAAGDGAVAFEKPGAAAGDKFDLSAIDANTSAANTQHFVFGTSHAAGHLWAVDSGSTTLIRGNVDADTAVEFEVAIQDGNVRASAYTSADFLLS